MKSLVEKRIVKGRIPKQARSYNRERRYSYGSPLYCGSLALITYKGYHCCSEAFHKGFQLEIVSFGSLEVGVALWSHCGRAGLFSGLRTSVCARKESATIFIVFSLLFWRVNSISMDLARGFWQIMCPFWTNIKFNLDFLKNDTLIEEYPTDMGLTLLYN